MNKKIAAITDMSFQGSGYFYLFTNLAKGLAKLGYEIFVAGLGYNGEPHDFPFSVIPCKDLQDAVAVTTNLVHIKVPDVILVAMDIPIQVQLHEQLKNLGKKYVAITPLENGPLTPSWAMPLMQMDCVFFISELGKQEAIKAGLKNAEHLLVGVDTQLWHPATPEEKQRLRDGLGIGADEFVVMTVADNQERKNLWAGVKAISLLKKEIPDRKIRYILVTRIDSPFGWKFPDLPMSLGVQKEVMLFNRGLPTKDLWGLYSASDGYLQPSKAEGLGLPVLEAMGCGIPVIATNTGALTELIEEPRFPSGTYMRGFLVEPKIEFIDVWGNERRHLIDFDEAAEYLKWLANSDSDDNQDDYTYKKEMTGEAMEYVRSRTWNKAISQFDAKLQELTNDQETQS